MTQKELNMTFKEQAALCMEIMQKKAREYTGDDADRLSAFKAAAALLRTTPERALAGMLSKHIISLYDMCFDDSMEYDIETWNEKITDSMNYLFLLKAVVKEEYENRQNRGKDIKLSGSKRSREKHGVRSQTDTERASDPGNGGPDGAV